MDHQYSRFEIKVAEQIIDQAIMNNKPHYLIKWKYLPHQYDTWESIENLQSIVDMLQNWIRNKRKSQEIHNFNSLTNAASYCDTVNFINPNKRQTKKRKIRQKQFKSQTLPNQVVVLDQEDQEKQISLKYEQCNFDHEQSSQILEEEVKKDADCKSTTKWGVNTRSKRLPEPDQKQQRVAYPLSFDPQKPQPPTPNSQPPIINQGMRVIGRVRSEDIESIIQHFVFKQTLCFKVELNDGRITNMREGDLKKLCPQMLMQYYEDNGMRV